MERVSTDSSGCNLWIWIPIGAVAGGLLSIPARPGDAVSRDETRNGVTGAVGDALVAALGPSSAVPDSSMAGRRRPLSGLTWRPTHGRRPSSGGRPAWSMAGRIRTAMASPEPARAACHPSGPERSGGGVQRLDTPLAEASPRSAGAGSVRPTPGATGERFDRRPTWLPAAARSGQAAG